jgi:hypothetical protein
MCRYMRTIFAAAAFAAMGACVPAYVPTIAPTDADFTVSCSAGCGQMGRHAGVLVDVSFVGHGRQFSVCCTELAATRARLQTIQDYWCDGLDVPEQRIGDIMIGTTMSEASSKRGATLDQGEGYVAFNCDDWLPKLIAELGEASCCSHDGK